MIAAVVEGPFSRVGESQISGVVSRQPQLNVSGLPGEPAAVHRTSIRIHRRGKYGRCGQRHVAASRALPTTGHPRRNGSSTAREKTEDRRSTSVSVCSAPSGRSRPKRPETGWSFYFTCRSSSLGANRSSIGRRSLSDSKCAGDCGSLGDGARGSRSTRVVASRPPLVVRLGPSCTRREASSGEIFVAHWAYTWVCGGL
jgi:hypothetical protein